MNGFLYIWNKFLVFIAMVTTFLYTFWLSSHFNLPCLCYDALLKSTKLIPVIYFELTHSNILPVFPLSQLFMFIVFLFIYLFYFPLNPGYTLLAVVADEVRTTNIPLVVERVFQPWNFCTRFKRTSPPPYVMINFELMTVSVTLLMFGKILPYYGFIILCPLHK